MSKFLLSKLIGLTIVEAREMIEYRRFRCRVIDDATDEEIDRLNGSNFSRAVNIYIVNDRVVKASVG